MERAATQADASFKANIEMSRNDQRAWIGVSAVDGLPKLNEPSLIAIRFKNTGRSPAQNVHVLSRYLPTPKGSEFKFDLEEVPEQSNGLIPPGAEFSAFAFPGPNPTAKLKKTDMDAATNGSYVVHVIAKATYDDAFGRPHWVTFCAQLATDAKSWKACSDYNDADKPN